MLLFCLLSATIIVAGQFFFSTCYPCYWIYYITFCQCTSVKITRKLNVNMTSGPCGCVCILQPYEFSIARYIYGISSHSLLSLYLIYWSGAEHAFTECTFILPRRNETEQRAKDTHSVRGHEKNNNNNNHSACCQCISYCWHYNHAASQRQYHRGYSSHCFIFRFLQVLLRLIEFMYCDVLLLVHLLWT